MHTFSGLTDRRGPLAWGQAMYYNLLAVNQFDVGGVLFTYLHSKNTSSRKGVARNVERLIERHESLRTLYEFAEFVPLTQPNASVRQRVFGQGTIPLRFFDASNRATLPSREELAEAFEVSSFDLRSEFPVFPIMVRLPGERFVAALFVSHSAIDGLGLENLRRDYAYIDTATGSHELPEQPIDRAREEMSDRYQRKNLANLEYLNGILGGLPQSMLTDATDEDHSLFAALKSTEITRAVGALARIASVTPPSVIIGTFALLQAYECSSQFAMVRTVYNRGSTRDSRYIAPNHLHALLRLDLKGKSTISEYFRAAQAACYRSYLHCDYDPTTFLGDELDLAAKHGTRSIRSFFGGVQFEREPAAAKRDWWPIETPERLAAELVSGGGDRLSSNSRVAFDFWPGTTGSRIQVRATHWSNFQDSAHFIRTFEMFLISAALSPDVSISRIFSVSFDGSFL